MEQIVNWFLINWSIILLIIENIVLLLTYVVKLTKNTEDDNWVARLKEFLIKLGLLKNQ
jgi:cytochrome b subunit of formate dehydrogenase